MVGPLEVTEKFRVVVVGGWWWSSDNTVSKVQVLTLDLTFGLDFGLLDLNLDLTWTWTFA